MKKVLFNVTNKCNLFCWHCYNDSSGKGNSVPTNICLKIAEKIANLRPDIVSLSGGEPLMLGQVLFEICDVLSSNGSKVVLLSNGTMMSEKNISGIVRHFWRVQMSIDKYNDTDYSHELKGNCLYGKLLLRSIGLLKETRIPVIFSHVPNIRNYNLFDYFDALYFNNVELLKTQFVIPVGRACGNPFSDLSDGMKAIYKSNLKAIHQKYRIPVKLYETHKFSSNTVCINCFGDILNNSFEGIKIGNILESDAIIQ